MAAIAAYGPDALHRMLHQTSSYPAVWLQYVSQFYTEVSQAGYGRGGGLFAFPPVYPLLIGGSPT